MSLEEDLIRNFEECWYIISELEKLSALSTKTGEIISAAKIDKLIYEYDSGFELFRRRLDEYFRDLADVYPLDFESDEEEDDEYEEGNHDLNW